MKFLYTRVLVVFSTLIIAACSTSEISIAGELGQVVLVEGGGQYTDIIPQELKGLMDEEDLFIVNVHVPYAGDIPATDAHVSFDEIEDNLLEFPAAKDAKIVVYCRSGSMSAISARDLVEAGYSSVYNLDGGFRAWSVAGYELIQ